VGLDDWILALHLLAAFAVVGAVAFFVVVGIATRTAGRPSVVLAFSRLFKVPLVMIMVGMPATLVFGIWLAISLDAYHPWDGWIIAAIVLWAIAGATGSRGGQSQERAAQKARELGMNALAKRLDERSAGRSSS
jgi:hypothetical protein